MRIIEAMELELAYEAGQTRKLLERIPEEHLDWRPHAKSYSIRQLASHIVECPSWVRATFDTDKFEIPADYKPYVGDSVAEILGALEQNVADALEVMKNATNEDCTANWQMLHNGQVILEMPRIACMRSFVLNHLIHHRGQMTVCLRLKDVPLPALYGPSADEQ